MAAAVSGPVQCAEAVTAPALDPRQHRFPPDELHRFVAQLQSQLQWSRETRWQREDRDGVHRIGRYYAKHAPDSVPAAEKLLGGLDEEDEDDLFDMLDGEYGEEPEDDEPVVPCPPHLTTDPAAAAAAVNGKEAAQAAGAAEHPRCRYGFRVETAADRAQHRDAEAAWRGRREAHGALCAEYHALGPDAMEARVALLEGEDVARHGLPDALRPRLYSDYAYARFRRDVGRYHGSLRTALMSKTNSTRAIKKDLLRTFPTNARFHCGGALYSALHNVLTAASHELRGTGGYCQSMNFIAGALLIATEDEAVSYAYMKHFAAGAPYNAGYYDQMLSNCRLDQTVLRRQVEAGGYPEVARLMGLGVRVEDFALRWFMCLFISVVPFRSALHFLDCYATRGIPFLFQFTLSILHSFAHVPAIRAAHDFADASAAVGAYVSSLTDVSGIIAHALSIPFTAADLTRERAAAAAAAPPPDAGPPAEAWASPASQQSDASPATKAQGGLGRFIGRGKK